MISQITASVLHELPYVLGIFLACVAGALVLMWGGKK